MPQPKQYWSLIAIALLIIAIAIAVHFARNSSKPVMPEADDLTSATLPTYTNTDYRFLIQYPTTLTATSTFDVGYLVGSTWSLYSDPTVSTGRPLVALIKKGSNDVLNAELRIGISTSTEDVSSCTKVDPTAENISQKVVNGIPFTTFSESGAAMSHFTTAKSYRVVHGNACFAIDEFIAGTNPDVYDPPRTPPYDQTEALKELDQAISTFEFY